MHTHLPQPPCCHFDMQPHKKNNTTTTKTTAVAKKCNFFWRKFECKTLRCCQPPLALLGSRVEGKNVEEKSRTHTERRVQSVSWPRIQCVPSPAAARAANALRCADNEATEAMHTLLQPSPATTKWRPMPSHHGGGFASLLNPRFCCSCSHVIPWIGLVHCLLATNCGTASS